jgi:hypothetical protein
MAASVSPATTTYVLPVGHDVGDGVAVDPDVAVAVGLKVGAGVGSLVVVGEAVGAAAERVGSAALVGAAVGLSAGIDPIPLITAGGADGLAIAGMEELVFMHPAMRPAMTKTTSQTRCLVRSPFKMGCPVLRSLGFARSRVEV